MRIIERDPLPQKCIECQEEIDKYGVDMICYNCDYALDRFILIADKDKESPE